MQRMEAVKPMRYAQVKLAPGEQFDCDDRHAPAFVAIGSAKKAEAAVPEPERPKPKKGRAA